MSLSKRVLLGASLSWVCSVTLGLVFAACVSGHPALSTLALPGVIPVALIGSTVAAIVMTPIATWSLRTGRKNLMVFGPILWALLAVWIVAVVPGSPAYGEHSVLVLALVGLVVLGFIPPGTASPS